MYKSGYINHRKRKIPIVWDGEHAQHIAENYVQQKSVHPFLHVEIQKLAKRVERWKKTKASRRHEGYVKKNDIIFLVVVEISNTFATIITCYRK